MANLPNWIEVAGPLVGLVGGIIGVAGGITNVITFWLRSSPKLVLGKLEKRGLNGSETILVHGVTNKGEGRADDVEVHAYVEYTHPKGLGRGFRALSVEDSTADVLSPHETALNECGILVPSGYFPFDPFLGIAGRRPLWIVITCRDALRIPWQFRYTGEAMEGGILLGSLRYAGESRGRKSLKEDRSKGRLFLDRVSGTNLAGRVRERYEEEQKAERHPAVYLLARERFEDRAPGFLFQYEDTESVLLFPPYEHEPVECSSACDAYRRHQRYAERLPAPPWSEAGAPNIRRRPWWKLW